MYLVFHSVENSVPLQSLNWILWGRGLWGLCSQTNAVLLFVYNHHCSWQPGDHQKFNRHSEVSSTVTWLPAESVNPALHAQVCHRNQYILYPHSLSLWSNGVFPDLVLIVFSSFPLRLYRLIVLLILVSFSKLLFEYCYFVFIWKSL